MALLVSASIQQDLWSPHHVVALGTRSQHGPERRQVNALKAGATTRRARGVPSLTRAGLRPLYQRGRGRTPRPEQVRGSVGALASPGREHGAQEEQGKGPRESSRIAVKGQGRRGSNQSFLEPRPPPPHLSPTW